MRDGRTYNRRRSLNLILLCSPREDIEQVDWRDEATSTTILPSETKSGPVNGFIAGLKAFKKRGVNFFIKVQLCGHMVDSLYASPTSYAKGLRSL